MAASARGSVAPAKHMRYFFPKKVVEALVIGILSALGDDTMAK
jgi:hypothetical protein